MTNRDFSLGIAAGAAWLGLTLTWIIAMADLSSSAATLRILGAAWSGVTLAYGLAGTWRRFIAPAWRQLMR